MSSVTGEIRIAGTGPRDYKPLLHARRLGFAPSPFIAATVCCSDGFHTFGPRGGLDGETETDCIGWRVRAGRVQFLTPIGELTPRRGTWAEPNGAWVFTMTLDRPTRVRA